MGVASLLSSGKKRWLGAEKEEGSGALTVANKQAVFSDCQPVA